MNYLDAGYGEFLSREDASAKSIPQLDPLSGDQLLDQMSGSTIQGGVMYSNDNNMSFDLEQNMFSVNDGVTDRVRIGIQEDGSIGIIIRDESGNSIFQVTGNSNILRSSNGAMELDFVSERLVFYDANGNPQAVFGNLT